MSRKYSQSFDELGTYYVEYEDTHPFDLHRAFRKDADKLNLKYWSSIRSGFNRVSGAFFAYKAFIKTHRQVRLTHGKKTLLEQNI